MQEVYSDREAPIVNRAVVRDIWQLNALWAGVKNTLVLNRWARQFDVFLSSSHQKRPTPLPECDEILIGLAKSMECARSCACDC